MTYSEVATERVNSGSFRTVFYTIDITSLANANNEPVTVASDLNLDEVLGVTIAGLENGDSYDAEWDHLEDVLYVLNNDGTDPTGGTDVGEVVLRVDGDASA